MPSIPSHRYLLALVALAASFSVHAAQARLGFTVSAETDGFFSTTLKQVKITSVVPGAPAEQAGLQAGDDVEAVNDVPVAGSSGSKIMDMVHAVRPGDHLRLKVRRKGAEQLVDIVGATPQ
jgi:C-terminal processing protease CtpA/Prc